MAEALDPALPPALDTLTKQVLREACERGLLVTAESCTGGLLASLLTMTTTEFVILRSV